MRKTAFITSFVVMALSTSTMAASLTVTNTFQAGSPAVAAEVNQNFTDAEDAVNDNDSRITNNASTLTSQAGRISANEAAIQANSNAIAAVRQAVSVFDNGVRLGMFLGGDSIGTQILNDQGYLYAINNSTMSPATSPVTDIYHLTTDCTGTAYVEISSSTFAGTSYSNGVVFSSQSLPLYVAKGTVATNITYNSRWAGGGFGCGTTSGAIDAYEVLPNDPAVTGVPNTFTGPITIGY